LDPKSLDTSAAALVSSKLSGEELRLAIVIWIERMYNQRRRQRALGRLTPVEYQTIYSVASAT
jgi:transposase InsO family protein